MAPKNMCRVNCNTISNFLESGTNKVIVGGTTLALLGTASLINAAVWGPPDMNMGKEGDIVATTLFGVVGTIAGTVATLVACLRKHQDDPNCFPTV